MSPPLPHPELTELESEDLKMWRARYQLAKKRFLTWRRVIPFVFLFFMFLTGCIYAGSKYSGKCTHPVRAFLFGYSFCLVVICVCMVFLRSKRGQRHRPYLSSLCAKWTLFMFFMSFIFWLVGFFALAETTKTNCSSGIRAAGGFFFFFITLFVTLLILDCCTRRPRKEITEDPKKAVGFSPPASPVSGKGAKGKAAAKGKGKGKAQAKTRPDEEQGQVERKMETA